MDDASDDIERWIPTINVFLANIATPSSVGRVRDGCRKKISLCIIIIRMKSTLKITGSTRCTGPSGSRLIIISQVVDGDENIGLSHAYSYFTCVRSFHTAFIQDGPSRFVNDSRS